MDLAGEGSALRAPSARVAALAATGAALILVVAGVTIAVGAPALLLLACLVAGFGLTYLSGLELLLEERFFYGAVIGAMAVSLAGFALAMVIGLTLTTAVLAAAAALAVSAAGWYRGRRRLPSDLRSAAERWASSPAVPGHPWPLLAVTAVAGAYTLKLFANAYRLTPDGLYAGTPSTWADWAAHLSYAGSFAYGANFPPQLPLDPGHHLPYPFMVDFFAALLVPLGSALTTSLVLTSGFLALAFGPVMYLAGVRLTGSRPVAALAPFFFALSGGLGFAYLFTDLDTRGLSVFQHLPREYTGLHSENYQWLAPILASLLPQRSTLFGLSLVLIVLAMLFTAVDRQGWKPFLAAGVLTGLTPAFHVHAYGTCVALAAFWAFFHRDRLRDWAVFFAPALLLGVPVVLWLLPETGAAFRVQLGWMAAADGFHESVPWFWLKNLGLFIPALVVAQFTRGLLPTRWAAHFAPVWLWFLVPNLILFHPWDWDNQKFFIYWALLGSFLVAALVVRIARAGVPGAAAAVVMSLILVGAGGLDAARDTDFVAASIKFADNPGLEVAAWSRTHTAPTATFLVASDHDSPIPTLGGRRVVLGYPGWIWTYGINDWVAREQDVEEMLQGRPEALDLARRYHVDYVVIGPQERQPPFMASDPFWRDHATLVYSNREYDVFKLGG